MTHDSVLGASRFEPTRRGWPYRRLATARSGSAAVEFALVAMPFLILVCTLIEAGINYFGQSILQQAVDDAGRQIYTGQFQTANAGTTDPSTLLTRFRTTMCYPNGQARITTFPCNDVRLSIRRAASFSSAAPTDATGTNPSTGATEWNADFASYTCARANDVMVVQAAIDVPIFFPLIGSAYASLSNGRRLLQAASVFQVEPFNSSAACPSGQ